jgi:hypothetical protein
MTMTITTLPHKDEDKGHLTHEMQHAIRCYTHDYEALTDVQEQMDAILSKTEDAWHGLVHLRELAQHCLSDTARLHSSTAYEYVDGDTQREFVERLNQIVTFVNAHMRRVDDGSKPHTPRYEMVFEKYAPAHELLHIEKLAAPPVATPK